MANSNGKHLLHVKSSQLNTDGNGPKLPTADQIQFGEIAINYADGYEKISFKNSTNTEIVTVSTDEQNDLKFETKERVAEIDEVTSKAFDTMNKSCGFNEEMAYIPQNELIQGTTSLAEAIEKVAEKANSGVDTSTLATKQELTDGLATKQDKGDYALKSELPDVSNFITNTVDNLVNYYKKSETYTKGEVDGKIGAITTINFEVVGELPVSGESNKIYLVPNAEQSEKNVKDEYIWVDGKWEIIGSTQVDLTNYLTKTEASSKYQPKGEYLTSVPSEYVTETELNGKGYATTAQVDLKANKTHTHTKSQITDFPSTLPNPTSFTIKVNSGTSEGSNLYTYNGTNAKTLDIKAGSNITLTPSSGSLTISSINTTYNVATTSVNGLMGSSDKAKLDGIATNANNYVHPTTSGNKHIPSGGSSGQILRWASDGTATWGNDNNTTYSQASSTTLGLVKIGYAENGKNYPVELSNGQMYVNVPWTDTNTTYNVVGGNGSTGLIKNGSSVTNASGYTACPIVGGVPYYKDTNTTYTLSSFGITATAAELNYCDGVTSNIQTQLNNKLNSDYYTGHSTTSSYTIPTTKRLCIATLTSSGSLSVGTISDGRELHIIVKNNGTSKITITFPTSGYVKLSGDTLDIESKAYAEINIISDGTTKYIRAI